MDGQYKTDGSIKEGFQIFREGSNTCCNLYLFASPNMEVPVVNVPDYIIALTSKTKLFKFKIYLKVPLFQYLNLSGKAIHSESKAKDVFCNFELQRALIFKISHGGYKSSKCLSTMVQIRNKINNGKLWLYHQLWNENDKTRWEE